MDKKSAAAVREEEILAFWKERHIFQKTLEKDAPRGEFVFYDGPPFATGLPHMGSLLSSIIKDVIPRYKTMRGFRVRRRWGWDCHGLPIENLVEKKLGLKTKKDIERIGVALFNETARASVLEFEREWERYIDRVGRFVDFRDSYKTMDNEYIESVWWALKELHDKNLLYEGRKVLMYCPHCETPLAKAEIAADNTYKDITEDALTVKFRLTDPADCGFPQETSVLAWTTTPWTLPGNVALAVGRDIDYALLKNAAGEHVITAKARTPEDARIIRTFPGKELLGLSYEPLYDLSALRSERSYKIYAGDFVSTEEGTGVVHTAVMYGEDDFALGQREHLPMVQLLDASARYNEHTPLFLRSRYIREAHNDIIADLTERGLLYAALPHTHAYPHCWRCGTPLIYNAVASWFINIQEIKRRLIEENAEITWVPEHLKEGRFRHILENAPDWTISRNRFWASPLPIWKNKQGGAMIIGSLEELRRRVKTAGNRYVVMRHGEAMHMLQGIYTTDAQSEFPLTDTGMQQVMAAAAGIPRDKPIVLLSSPVLRARQSAEILARELGIPPSAISIDPRLAEIQFGPYDGRPKAEYQAYIEQPAWYTARPVGGESLEDVKIRFGQALYDYESTYAGSTVVLVTHRIAFEALHAVCEGARGDRIRALAELITAGPAALVELPFVPLPVNARFELDLHRPYADSLTLRDDEGVEYTRIPEVVDCWVESGAMPFAEWHYPFEHRDEFALRTPADFIAEYIAQTRTWFYYLHALGTALFNAGAFRTVVSTGTILAADGSKMSKSKGNYTDPLDLMDRFGADAVRFSLMASVVMQGEDLKFRDEDVREAHNRVISMLWNTYQFYALYRPQHTHAAPTMRADSPHPLDRWIRSRLGLLLREATDAYESYDLPKVCRGIRAFIDDYSTWYIRRSRDRVRGGANEADMQVCLATQREVLLTLSIISAPITPFISDSIYRALREEHAEESVHLAHWPEEIAVNEELLADMDRIRAAASAGLQARDAAGIKVRQPLSLLRVRDLPDDPSLRAILEDEVNVKRIERDPSLAGAVWLDSDISDDLRLEGMLRDVLRAVQDARKRSGLSVTDRPVLRVAADLEGKAFFERFRTDIIRQTGLADLAIEEEVALLEGETGVPFGASFHFM